MCVCFLGLCMIFSSQNSKLVYNFEPLSVKPMQGNEVVYLTVLAPWEETNPIPHSEVSMDFTVPTIRSCTSKCIGSLHATFQCRVGHATIGDWNLRSYIIEPCVNLIRLLRLWILIWQLCMVQKLLANHIRHFPIWSNGQNCLWNWSVHYHQHIHYNQPLVCGYKFHYENLRSRVSSFQQHLRKSNCHKLKVLKLGQLVMFLFSLLKYTQV
jgi:hypothetical protein